MPEGHSGRHCRGGAKPAPSIDQENTMSNPLTTRNKVGLVLAALLAVGDIAAVGSPTPDGETGPPIAILIFSAVCGVVTLVATIPAWRSGERSALRVVAGTRILSAITALPAFFVDIPAGLVALTAVFVILTVVAVVMVLTPARQPMLVTD
jgi:hypothetical protein